MPGHLAVNALGTATATHAAAVVTFNALNQGQSHQLDALVVSFSQAPSAAVLLTVQDGSTTVFQVTVSATGIQQIPIPQPIIGSSATNMVITLPDGGPSVVGCVNAFRETVPTPAT